MITEIEVDLFHKLNMHVLLYNIELVQFWKTNRLCISMEEFSKLLKNIDFQYQNLKLIQTQLITLESVLQNVGKWKKQQLSISQFLSTKTLQKQKVKDESFRINIDSRQNTKSLYSLMNTMKVGKTNFLKNHMKRQKQEMSKLYKTMTIAKNQSDYEITIKVSELNDICKKLKNGFQYIINTMNGNIQIIQKKGTKETIISVKIFDRKFQAFKQAHVNQVEDFEGSIEEDLKKVYTQVLGLSSQLEEQIKLLQKKGILH